MAETLEAESEDTSGGSLTVWICGGVVGVALLIFAALLISDAMASKARVERLATAEASLDRARESVSQSKFEDASLLLDELTSLFQDSSSRSPAEKRVLEDADALAAKIKPEILRLAEEREAERKRLEEEKAKADALAAEKKRQEEALRREEEKTRLAQEKAREIYPAYKESAAKVADEVLKIISATEVGINYAEYGKMVRELKFEWNKFESRCNDLERQYLSYFWLKRGVDKSKNALDLWQRKINASTSDIGARYEALLQSDWSTLKESHRSAMAELAKDN